MRLRFDAATVLVLVLGLALGFALARYIEPLSNQTGAEKYLPVTNMSETRKTSAVLSPPPAAIDVATADVSTSAIHRGEELRSRSAQRAAETMVPRFLEEYLELLNSYGINDPVILDQVRERLPQLTYIKYQYAYAMADFETKRDQLERVLENALGEKWQAFSEREELAKSRMQYELIRKHSTEKSHQIPDELSAEIVRLIHQTEALEGGIIYSVGGPFSDPPHNNNGPYLDMIPRYLALQEMLIDNSGRLRARLSNIGADARTIQLISEYYSLRIADYDASIDRNLKRLREKADKLP